MTPGSPSRGETESTRSDSHEARSEGDRSLRDAVEVVREEQVRTRADRDAFDAFVERVDDVSAVRTGSTNSALRSVAARTPAGSGGLKRVRQAYAETVMDVAHYDEDYGDTIVESMAEEFGTDLATQLCSEGAFTTLLKGQLVRASSQCRREREEFLTTLNAERNALGSARTTLDDVSDDLDPVTTRLPSEFSLQELISTHSSLETAEQECEALLEARQQHRVDGHAAVDAPRAPVPDLQTYLYQSLPVTYPVLVETTALVDRLRRVRRQLSRELGTRY